MERKLFTSLNDAPQEMRADTCHLLCRAGFRRSHDILYRPACEACAACVPVRIPVRFFSPSRSLKRVTATNRDLHLDSLPPQATADGFALFNAYLNARHKNSDMAAMTEAEFSAMVSNDDADTRLYCLRDTQNTLKGCLIADFVGDGFSAVYSFFDPSEPKRSLGMALVLSLIDAARSQNLPYVYLGYWIENSRKMSYKSRFKPLERLTPQGWSIFSSDSP